MPFASNSVCICWVASVSSEDNPYSEVCRFEMLLTTLHRIGAQPAYVVQVLRFYERQGLKLPQQPPLLMVKSAELGNAASREQHPSSDRETPRGSGGAPVMHTRWRLP